MGNYVSTAEVIARFPTALDVAHLTGDESDGTPDTDKVEREIAAAEFAIDCRLTQKYVTGATLTALGYTGLNAGLKSDAGALAEINLIRLGPGMADFKRDEEEKILEKYDRVAKGELSLPASATVTSTPAREPQVDWDSSERKTGSDSQRLFSRDATAQL